MEHLENKTHILVVDDDERIRKLLSRFLRDKGYIVSTAEHARHALTTLRDFIYDLLILDVMMPGDDGFTLGKNIREKSDVPIIYLTAKSELQDKAEGYGAGGDDYLSKPFEPEELVLRIEALLKRHGLNMSVAGDDILIGRNQLNVKTNQLNEVETGKVTPLTDVESRLLQVLLRKRGQTVSRYDLSHALDLDPDSRTVDVQVTRLRRKIESDPKNPTLLQTVRGKGYILHERD